MFSEFKIRTIGRKFGAGNEIRTRDPDLGKVVLYQLSYSRISCNNNIYFDRLSELQLPRQPK